MKYRRQSRPVDYSKLTPWLGVVLSTGVAIEKLIAEAAAIRDDQWAAAIVAAAGVFSWVYLTLFLVWIASGGER